MKIGAYVIAGDPAWVTDSLESYYDLVSHIVVTFDAHGKSWNGHDLPVRETLERIRALDRDNKVIELPGDHCDPERFILDLETEQRQAAIERVGTEVDWVLQLDSDEVLASPTRFLECLQHADDAAAHALDYPQRAFYQRTLDGRFLELARRTWGVRSGYPGAAAVRAGTVLRHCRQTDAPTYRVDLRAHNTDPAHPADALVDEVVRPEDAILHLWWVRTEAQMASKRIVSGHADAFDWDAELRGWRRAAHHPLRAALVTPFHGDRKGWLRITRCPIELRSQDWYDPTPHR